MAWDSSLLAFLRDTEEDGWEGIEGLVRFTSLILARQQQQCPQGGQISWGQLGAALLYYHKSSVAFYCGAQWPCSCPSTAWVFGEPHPSNLLSV